MASLPQVCGLFPPPERTDALNAISKTIFLIRRRYSLNAKDIARSLKNGDGTEPHPDTIERAERRESLLSFDLIAQIAFIYRECADPLRALLDPAPTGEPTTLEERLERIEREAALIRQEIAA
jgi:hypothetical protein